MSFTTAVQEMSEALPLFEKISDRDEFLKNAVLITRKNLAADMAAFYLYKEETRQTEFRAGIDSKGVLIHARENSKDVNPEIEERFHLDTAIAESAYREGRVLRHSPDSPADNNAMNIQLVIPVVRGPLRIGILVLGSRRKDTFDTLNNDDILSGVTLLGDLLDEASALIFKTLPAPLKDRRVIFGRKAGPGTAAGTAFPFWTDIDSVAGLAPPPGSPREELKRFEKALKQSTVQLEDIRTRTENEVSETGAMIFMAQLLMLRDPGFTGEMRQRIQNGTPAVNAIRSVVNEYARIFSEMTEIRLAEKAQDTRDLGYRIVTNLAGKTEEEFSYKGKIALTRHIYPSDLFRLALEGVAGIVLSGGGATSHISILARSLGLPVLIAEERDILSIKPGTPLILDAGKGRLLINPDPADRKKFAQRTAGRPAAAENLIPRGLTSDGTPVQVLANVNILKDAEEARRQGAEGIGLYRSEFPFILKNDILSEEQQYRIYRSIAESQGEKPVTFRTADIGGDKILRRLDSTEENPFLGVRGIRFSLAHREVFRNQLRAMLRAGAGCDMGIMLPMVSGVEEIMETRREIEKCKESLRQRGTPFNENPRIGAMIEIPSAALAARELAEETDFLSIGTNDLIMYLLAVDRTNQNLSHLYRSHHPIVLRTLASIVRNARESGTDISVCGDSAAEPTLTPFFVGIGVRKLSVSPSEVQLLKKNLAGFSISEAEKTAEEMLSINRIREMDAWLEDFRKKTLR